MVLIKDLKESIENGTVPEFLIFVCKNSFLARHYLSKISEKTNKTIRYVDDEFELSTGLFSSETNDILVYCCDKLKNIPNNPKGIIICESVDTKLNSNDVCEFPQIEEWQLKDYLFSLCEGASPDDLEYIFSLLKSSPERLMLEAERINLFTKDERKFFVKEMIRSGCFSDISNETIYTLSNALCVKNIEVVNKVLREINAIDIEPIGLVTVMVNNFRNLLLIQGNPSPTPEKTGIPAKQFYAVLRNTGHYSISQLMYLLKELDTIDYKLKTGYLPANWIIPYVINLILSVK